MPKSDSTAPISKVEAMKNAGFPPWLMAIIMILSIPGMWEFFFNKKANVAEAKAEVSYQLLKDELVELREKDSELMNMIRDNQRMLLQLALRMGSANADTPRNGTRGKPGQVASLSEDKDTGIAEVGGVASGVSQEGSGGGAASANADPVAQIEQNIEASDKVKADIGRVAKKRLPDSLDELSSKWLQKKEM